MDRDDWIAGGGDPSVEEHPDDWAAMVAAEAWEGQTSERLRQVHAELAGEAPR
ncbi:hypothetical protein [Halostreptopolyspora alba]|uniref:hypothetical protein n=1 Tax=Halostreptopolyspora alba TaxID=2487137 RepID=UPI002690AF38